jgi:hypothetical protein
VKDSESQDFQMDFGIGPWIIVSVLNLCPKKCIKNLGLLGHFKSLKVL